MGADKGCPIQGTNVTFPLAQKPVWSIYMAEDDITASSCRYPGGIDDNPLIPRHSLSWREAVKNSVDAC